MMKIVLGALALTAATTPALANNWSTTDRDLASLSSSLTQNASGVSVSGFLRSSYVGWSDADVGGFSIDDAQIWVNGTVGDFGVVIQTEAAGVAAGLAYQADFDGDGNLDDLDGDGQPDTFQAFNGGNTPFSTSGLGSLGVLDAYATWNATEMIKVQVGQFRPAFLASSARNENNLLFINRSILGAAASYRDQGAQVSGSFGMVNVAAYMHNGEDSVLDEVSFGLRAEATVMGTASGNEGALGASGDPSLTVGLGYMDDKSNLRLYSLFAFDSALAVDANFTMGALGFSAEIVDLADDGSGLSFDTTPFNVTGSFVIMPDQLEAAIRYEDMDDGANTELITLGANWYIQGHAAKWQFNYVDMSSDFLGDTDHFQVGLTVSM